MQTYDPSGGVGICSYAISPPFLPLHRLLYYLSLFFALIWPRPPPLIKGAFAYALTQSAIAALYSMIMALPMPAPLDSPQNLDVLPVWAMLSVAAISLPAFLNWNRTVERNKSARPIVRFWGILITLGTACALVNLRVYSRISKDSQDLYSSPDSPDYLSRLIEDCQALSQTKRVMRPLSHVGTVNPDVFTYKDNFWRMWSVTPYLTFIPLAVGAIACLISIAPPSKTRSSQAPEVSSNSDPLLEGSTEAKLFRGLEYYIKVRRYFVALTPGFWITTLVLNEMFVLYDMGGTYGLPVTEELYEVGQWGVWAGLGVVVVASVVHSFAVATPQKVQVTMYNGGQQDLQHLGHEGTEYGGIGRRV